MNETDRPHCSFCGIEKSTQTPLIAGTEGRICEACVNLAHQVVNSWGQRRKSTILKQDLRTPETIKKHLDDYVIGQDTAKETLAVGVYNHYLRLINRTAPAIGRPLDTVELEKANILLAGPSGTGKTLLVRSLARILGVPFASADATTLTQAGYVGDDVDSIIVRLVEAAGGDVQQAQWGIVYIDEVDKLAKRNSLTATRDISGEGVQQALLKMVEGTELKISKTARRREGDDVTIDTSNILFIVGGAFPGLEELVARRVQPHTGIGFHAPLRNPQGPSVNELLAELMPEDLQKFGLIPEFIGRFPVISFLKELDQESLVRILTEPRNALVKQYKQLFSYQGIELEVTDKALVHIAKQAMQRKTGARGLRAIMESTLRSVMFGMPSRAGLQRCILDIQEKGAEEVLTVREIYHQPVQHSRDKTAGQNKEAMVF